VKIAIDARELAGKPTGVGRFLAEILAAWKTMPEAQAHEFILCAPGDDGPSTSLGGGPSTSLRAGGTMWEQLRLPRLVRDARADVLFAPGYSGPIVCPVPMVVAIHDVSFAAHPEWFSWREGARRRTTARLSARAAARVVTISQFSKREIVAHLGIDGSKIVVAYPGVADLTLRQAQGHPERSRGMKGPPRSVGRALLGSPPALSGPPTVLFVGSIFNRRHVPELIDGFARLARAHTDARLDIVGENRTSPRVDLVDVMRATGLADRVDLRSYVSDDELRAIYDGASAFVFLSEYEGFGLTPLEALAAGVPVLLLDTPVARETCGDAAIYVARPDPALIEAALTTLLFDPVERTRILTASQRVLARYSRSECARQVLQALEFSAKTPGVMS
jgi:glycosyltransferase involved in cell wall biosynthesis